MAVLCAGFGPAPARPRGSTSDPAQPERAQLLDHHARSSPAWLAFAASGTWSVAWDAATGVPSRIWGSGLAAPGASNDPAIAEAFARRVLREHLALLAPGARIDDFRLVANHSDGELRSIGFLQYFAGRRVVGGQVSFRFKADRLFVIGSEALPDVRVAFARSRIAGFSATAAAKLRAHVDLPHAPVTAPGEDVVYPVVTDAGVKAYRHAVPMTIDGGAGGKYLAYLDPATGDVIAALQQNLYATGTLLYRSVDRHPLRPRVDYPARTARVTIAGAAQTTGTDGSLTWTPDQPTTIETSVAGSLVEIVNKSASGALATAQLSIAPGGQAVWDASANGEVDAQVVTYLAVNRVKDHVRAFIDPAMKGLDEPIKANVNIDKSCNAFFDGTTINFFSASMSCQNTGLLEDVVFHEFGHALHRAEIIEGVGRHDGAMSEGAADFLAAQITEDSGMGRGLFYNEEPLRQIDPPGDEFRWPDDITEIHGTGRIFAGTFWDLRKALIAQHGQAAGNAATNRIYVATLRRATSIPTAFIEALAADDDDGDLDNGTPNECAIRDAFGRHGLRFATGTVDAPATLVTTDPTTTVRFRLSGLSTRCTSDAIDRVLMIYIPGGSKQPTAGTAVLTETAPGVFEGALPLPADDVVYYSTRVMFADGSTLHLADNLADRFYTLYQGETVPLYCTSFDDDPFASGWKTGTSNQSPSPWIWQNGILEQAGTYPKEISTYAELPTIDIGKWSDVHLQYRRMLEVEDSQFDKAKISVDGSQAWINDTANRGDSSARHHVDREWRFHDVRVSGLTQGHLINIAFELSADAGLELGGWALDELCVVANVHSICGDGVVSPTEACDDGDKNGARPDACRTWCQKPRCGDRIVDSNEECDHGLGGSDECTAKCVSLVETGCCSAQTHPGFAWLVILFVLRRRRR